jgi:xanthine dehydrogenase YagR molybdenum-binding subunit
VTTAQRSVGTGVGRLEGRLKVTGQARYSGEIPLPGLVYGWLVTSTISRGRVTAVGADPVLAMPGVLAVLHHGNALKLGDAGDPALRYLQDDRVRHYGDVVALVVATSSEEARAGAEALTVEYEREPHDVEFTTGHPKLYTPDQVNPNFPAETVKGDVEKALAEAEFVVDATYSTPVEHNNPMEPHATTAQWSGDELTVYDSNQGVFPVHQALAQLFSLPPGAVQVVSEHVGGGFGGKLRAGPNVVLASMAAKVVDRPVRVTLTRQQMFALTGHRTPTVQRVRLGAGADARLTALDHLAYSQTSTILEFAEQTAVMSRVMYAAGNLRTSHRVVAQDVPTPRWMRAPGEAPGSFALESAMDELAHAIGIDPIELRIRNEPSAEPASGKPFSSRNLVACYRDGARRFGWAGRDPRPGVRHDGRWLLGTGMAASTYPARARPSTASVTVEAEGGYTVRIAAADIGTGARTVLTQVAADELGVPLANVRVLVGDSGFGQAMIAGGSMGTASWSWAVVKACREALQASPGQTVTVDTGEDIAAKPELVSHSYGAQFAEVAVDLETGEIRVPRLLGVFAAGRILNPVTARSQLVGGMTMGLSMALHEETVLDPVSGGYLNHDLAGYHFAANADVRTIEAEWVEDESSELNPSGVKGLGEVGIVGTAAAIANAVWHATGLRLRDLPLRLDRVLPSS